MENLGEGKTYQTLLAERQGRGFSELEVTEILRIILPNLAQIHAQGLAHGAISPATLIQYSNSQQPTLIQTSTFPITGYIAPEQLLTGKANPAGDIYALGVTIIVLLTAQNIEVLRNYDGSLKWQDYCLVSDQLAELLERSISPQIQNRYANAMEMLQAMNNPLTPTVISPLGGNNFAPEYRGNDLKSYNSIPFLIPNLAGWQWGLIGGGFVILIGLASFGIMAIFTGKNNPQIASNSPVPVSGNEQGFNKTAPEASAYSAPQSSRVNLFDSVAFPRSTCGDPRPVDPSQYPVNFYPVFVPYSERNLSILRSRFCDDAYKMTRTDKGIEAIQVSSFTSYEKAEMFKDFLNKNVGGAEVGQPTRVEFSR